MRPITLALSLLAGCSLGANDEQAHDTLTFTEPVDSVRFDLAAGDVHVEVADVAEIVVERALAWFGGRPAMVARVRDGALVLEVDCDEGPFSRCHVDHTVFVPAGVTLTGSTGAGDVTGFDLLAADVFTGAGDVKLVGVAGEVLVDAGAGDVSLSDVTGDVHVQTGAGEIDGDKLASGYVWADSGSGDVNLGLDLAPQQVDVFTGAGDVTLRLPSGAIHLSTHTGAGDVTISGVDRDPDAAVEVNLETGAGDIVVRGR